MCSTDANSLISRPVRRKKAVSGLTFEVGSGSRGLTSSHQRCDGKRPCTTCVNGERSDECTYEKWQRSSRMGAGVLPASHDTASHPLNARALSSKPSATGFPSPEPRTRLSSVPPITWPNPSKSASFLLPPPSLTPYERPLASSSRVHREIEQGPLSDVSVAQDMHKTTERVTRPAGSSFTVLPSIHFRAIPRPLQVPLSLIPPERVQISSIAWGDLDMNLCVLLDF